MFAYDDMLGQVREWKDRPSTQSDSRQAKPTAISSNTPRRHTSAAFGAAPVPHPPAPPQSASKRESLAAAAHHKPPSLPPISSMPLSSRHSRSNNIPLRQLSSVHNDEPKKGGRDEYDDEYFANGGDVAGADGKVQLLSKAVQRRLYSPRKAPKQQAQSSNPESQQLTHRSESFIRMERELEARTQQTRTKPGLIPFTSGGNRNVAWHKHLPTPPNLIESRRELLASRQKDGAKAAEDKLVTRLYRWPKRPEPKYAPEREPLTEAEETELVNRLYVVKNHDDDEDDEDTSARKRIHHREGGGEDDDGDEEIDVDEQVDRLYYQALEQQKRKRQKALADEEKQLRRMRTPRTTQNGGIADRSSGSGSVGGAKSRSPYRKGFGELPPSADEARGAYGTNDDDDHDEENGKRSEAAIKETFHRLYDKAFYDRRTEEALRKAGYMI